MRQDIDLVEIAPDTRLKLIQLPAVRAVALAVVEGFQRVLEVRLYLRAPGIDQLARAVVRLRVGRAVGIQQIRSNEFSRSFGFEVVPFDQRAAIECSIGIRATLSSGNRKGKQNAVWSMVKFDHQIVAIARSRLVTCIYSDDKGLRNFVRSIGQGQLDLGDRT
ncbi:hypothetical protein [Paraburkholderia sp.]|uniref:hypothetical protein n=1 Tax=Paraburkholderia sp. TaxID=1926495 RepID=UPI0039E22B71